MTDTPMIQKPQTGSSRRELLATAAACTVAVVAPKMKIEPAPAAPGGICYVTTYGMLDEGHFFDPGCPMTS